MVPCVAQDFSLGSIYAMCENVQCSMFKGSRTKIVVSLTHVFMKMYARGIYEMRGKPQISWRERRKYSIFT